MRGAALTVILWLAAAGCASVKPWEKVDLASLPTPQSMPDARHVVLLKETTVRFVPDADSGRAVEETAEHVREKILRPNDSVYVGLPYAREMSRVVDLRARVILPDGTERTYEKKDASDVLANQQAILFSDVRVMAIDLEQPPVGAVVEWESTRVDNEPLYFPARVAMKDVEPVKEMRFSVEYPEGWEVEVAHLDGDATPESAPIHADGMVKRSWLAHDVADVRDEHESPEWEPPRIVVRLLRWTENGATHKGFTTAEEFSDWSATLFGKTPGLDPEMKRVFDKVLAGAPDDPREKTKRLYDWVKDEIQYCAVEVGWGGWKPIAPSEVTRVRYGDCKGKAELLHTFLAAAGITSHPVMIRAHARQPIPFHLSLISQNFNHVIDVVDLPGGRLVLDPTSKEPFGQLPEMDQGADLLPVIPGGEPIMKAPLATADQNREEHDIDLELSPSGDVKGTLQLKAWNISASELEHAIRSVPKKKIHRLLEERADLAEGTVIDPVVHTRTSGDDAFTVEARAHLRSLAQAAGSSGTLRIGARLLGNWLPSLAPGPRERPVWLGPAQSRSEHITMRVPHNMSAFHLPDSVDARCAWADYHLAYRFEKGAVVIQRDLKVTKSEVEASGYPELVAFLDKVHAAEAQAILLGTAR